MTNSMEWDLWRERRRELAREIERERVVGGPGFLEAAGGWIRSGVRFLGRVAGYRVESGEAQGDRAVRVGESPVGGERRHRGRIVKRDRRDCVDTTTALNKFEASLKNQLALATGDSAVETAGNALLASLQPAVRQLVWDLAEQAAREVDEQLEYGDVEVTMREGDPVLRVRESEGLDRETFLKIDDGKETRITLRLPENLKNTIEQAARSAGDSVNSYLVKDIARSTSRGGRVGKSFKGTVRS